MRGRRGLAAFAVALAGLLAAADGARAQGGADAAAVGAAAGAEDAAPTRTEAFEDWSAVCRPLADNGELCRAAQVLTLKDSGRRLAAVAAGPTRPAGERMLVLSLPLGLRLGAGVTMRVDDAEPRTTAFQTCTPAGCHAALPLTEDLTDLLKTGLEMTLTVEDTSGQRIAVPVSLVGFSDALEAAEPTW